MIQHPPFFAPHRRGSALVIVLAVVLLLTIITVAFFTHVTNDRKVSDSSANQTRAALLAEGAADTIIGDLKQEIVDGSGGTNAAPTAPTAANFALYLPSSPQTMVPALQGTSSGTAGMENVVKSSIGGQPFYQTTPYATYETKGPSRAVGNGAGTVGSTVTPSLNGRYISPARWNAPLLMTKLDTTQATDLTPIGAKPAEGGTLPTWENAPDWILVGADGSNPGAGATTLPPAASTIDTTQDLYKQPFVVGRYAYQVYDEGGLLDANVAGYPSVSTLGQSAYKPAEAYADLTQLPPTGPKMTTTMVDALVAWRNSASAQISGSASLTSTNAANYFASILSNTTGFLSTWGTPLPAGIVQSDRLFGSRHELIQFLTRNVAQTAADQTTLQNALQYLGTFTRSLNQPSLNPLPASATGGTTTRPAILSAFGGNDSYGLDTGSKLDSSSSPTLANQMVSINPKFLSVLVPKTVAGGRNDGSDLTLGDPLVKKRFDLRRLAWLTYGGAGGTAGPSALRNLGATSTTAGNPDADIAQLLNTNSANGPIYGITKAFLAQGTASNVYKYFGLTWITDANGAHEWAYSHLDNASTASFSTVSNIPLAAAQPPYIKTLAQVAALNREPDFVELLKAAITAGAVGKTANAFQAAVKGIPSSFSSGNDGTASAFSSWSVAHDCVSDAQILQIAANIIDQADCDGYPTRIAYNFTKTSTSAPDVYDQVQEVQGVENLPYLYRLRQADVKAEYPVYTPPANAQKDGGPATTAGTTDNQATAAATLTSSKKPLQLTKTGVLVGLLESEVWNPHDPNCSLGNPRPSLGNCFRVLVDNTFPANAALAQPIGKDYAAYNPTASAVTGSAFSLAGTTAVPIHSTDKHMPSSTPATGPLLFPSPAFPDGTPGPQMTKGDPDGYNTYTSPTYFAMVGDPSKVPSVPGATVVGTAITFSDGNGKLFRQPTLLYQPGIPSGSNLMPDKSSALGTSPIGFNFAKNFPNQSVNGGGGVAAQQYPKNLGGSIYMGGLVGVCPLAWVAKGTSTGKDPNSTAGNKYSDESFILKTYRMDFINGGAGTGSTPWQNEIVNGGEDFQQAMTFRAQYTTDGTNWITYDTKVSLVFNSHSPTSTLLYKNATPFDDKLLFFGQEPASVMDPRVMRFGMPGSADCVDGPPYESDSPPTPTTIGSSFDWVDHSNNTLPSARFDATAGYGYYPNAGVPVKSTNMTIAGKPARGWFPGQTTLFPGLYSQNDPNMSIALSPSTVDNKASAPPAYQYYSDADGVVRRAMGAYYNSNPAASFPYNGLPMATGDSPSPAGASSPPPNTSTQTQSSPIILNRPFRSVTDFGYVFSGTPWKNLSMFTPESGFAGLLDVFCVGDTTDPSGLVAGKVNLNTRQVPVLQAILAGAYKDENLYAAFTPANQSSTPSGSPTSSQPALTPTAEAQNIAQALVTRTSQGPASPSNPTVKGPQPLTNISDLVGKWVKPVTLSNGGIDGSQSYDGFSADLSSATLSLNTPTKNIGRYREAAMRALANAGQTRVWNLMIDVIAQTGRYPAGTTSPDNFVVQGEKRYWVHVAIDRLTGRVLDKQIEESNE